MDPSMIRPPNRPMINYDIRSNASKKKKIIISTVSIGSVILIWIILIILKIALAIA